MNTRKEDGLWKVVVAKDQALCVSYGSRYAEEHQSLGNPSVIRDVYKNKPPIPFPKDFSCDTCNVTESTIIATTHCTDVGYCLFRNPLVTHIPYHVPSLLL